MELLSGVSYLQLFWGVQAAYVGYKVISSVQNGSFFDRTQGEREPQAKVGLFQFRKRFTLYYFVGILFNGWVWYRIVGACVFGHPLNSDGLQRLLGTVAAPLRGSTDATCAAVAATMFLVHNGRRFYETLYVNIFSQRQTRSPPEVLLDLAFVVGAGLSLVAEVSYQPHATSTPTSCRLWHIPTVMLFGWASLMQHRCYIKLAKLRRNRMGHIVTTGYKIPKGDWFDYVCSPQYFAESVIYVTIGLVLGLENVTWWSLAGYVATSQLYLAYSARCWYRQKFEEFPKERKMIIPYIL